MNYPISTHFIHYTASNNRTLTNNTVVSQYNITIIPFLLIPYTRQHPITESQYAHCELSSQCYMIGKINITYQASMLSKKESLLEFFWFILGWTKLAGNPNK